MKASTEARALLLENVEGILSTHSVDMPGYPFGSIVPYCLDQTGQPIILISTIAQHTKNILANPKMSLITTEKDVVDVQTGARLTLIADAQPLDGEDLEQAGQRYYEFFPQSRGYHKTHDFNFYRLEVVRARFIGGFGKIHWIESQKLLKAIPFSAEQEAGMITHMNEDHADAMKKYCADAEIEIGDHDPEMAGIDEEGFHLRLGEKIVRLTFSEPAQTAEEVRARLVAMVRSKEQTE